MTYVPNMPNASDIPSVSQAQLKINFQKLYSSFAINHEALDAAAALVGKHRFCTLTPQGAGPATLATEIALYSKSLGGNYNLFYRRQGSGTEIPLTGPVDPLAAANGYTFLPGGLFIQWGTVASIPATSSAVIAFPTNFTTAYSVVTQKLGGNGANDGAVSALGAGSFTLYNNSSVARAYYWIAIGSR